MSAFKRIFDKTGMDGAVILTIISRLIQAGGGVLSIIFISKFLNANQQGYFYTFSSILGIQIFFELGLSGIITQYTAYEFAHLHWDNQYNLIGDPKYSSRLASLLKFFAKWFGILSFLLFILLWAVGFFFFSKYNANLNINWQQPWLILCLATSMNLFIDPILAFFDGLNEVKDMARVRLIQKTCNILLLFLFFELGLGLYSSALASLGAVIINYLQILFSKRLVVLKAIWSYRSNWVINYYKEIFSYQWRIALSWISGYFIFQLFNPVLFATEGAIVAGQMGMTIAVLSGLSSISMSWITTKVPLMSTLIATKNYKSLDDNFTKIFVASIGSNLIGMIFLIILVRTFQHNHYPIGNRFLQITPFLYMCISSLINQAIFALATYLRCHKKEPMLVQSVVMGLLVCFSTLYFGKKYGLYGISFSYFLLTSTVGLLWTIQIFLSKRKQWHYV